MKRQAQRQARGSALAEFGPALMLLLIMLFFPLLDLMTMAVTYTSCLTLNEVQCREAANLPSADAPSMMATVCDNWRHTGMGAFVQLTGKPVAQIQYSNGETDSNGSQDKYVQVTTTLSARPFLTLPFFPIIPGLTAPISYSVTTRRMLENPHFA